MTDILEGDLLVVGTDEHPIKAVEVWSKANFNTRGFIRMASVSMSTKRVPVIVDGKRGTATTKLSGLKGTPLDPVSAEVIERLGLDSPVRLLETFIGDSTGFLHLIVEELQFK